MPTVRKAFQNQRETTYQVVWDNGDTWEYRLYDRRPFMLEAAYREHHSDMLYANRIKQYASSAEKLAPRPVGPAESLVEEMVCERAIDRIESRIKELRRLLIKSVDPSDRKELQQQLNTCEIQRREYLSHLPMWS